MKPFSLNHSPFTTCLSENRSLKWGKCSVVGFSKSLSTNYYLPTTAADRREVA